MKTKLLFLVRFIVLYTLAIIFLYGCGVPMVESSKRMQLFNNKTIYVYPVHMLSISREESFDTIIAKKIVAFINAQGDFKSEFVNKNPQVNSEWSINEAKMFKKSFIAFSYFLKTDMQTGEYGFLVEFLVLPHEIDMHYFLVDKNENKTVLRQLINSHNPLYQEINPQNKEDAFQLFCKVFKYDVNKLKEGK